ncbi:MAG: HD domain-containing protein [Syntrophobacteraceae bacterium]
MSQHSNNDAPESKLTTPLSDASFTHMIHFFFELGMLKKTPRSGYQFLGSGGESVADHTFRMTLIGYYPGPPHPGRRPPESPQPLSLSTTYPKRARETSTM